MGCRMSTGHGRTNQRIEEAFVQPPPSTGSQPTPLRRLRRTFCNTQVGVASDRQRREEFRETESTTQLIVLPQPSQSFQSLLSVTENSSCQTKMDHQGSLSVVASCPPGFVTDLAGEGTCLLPQHMCLPRMPSHSITASNTKFSHESDEGREPLRLNRTSSSQSSATFENKSSHARVDKRWSVDESLVDTACSHSSATFKHALEKNKNHCHPPHEPLPRSPSGHSLATYRSTLDAAKMNAVQKHLNELRRVTELPDFVIKAVVRDKRGKI